MKVVIGCTSADSPIRIIALYRIRFEAIFCSFLFWNYYFIGCHAAHMPSRFCQACSCSSRILLIWEHSNKSQQNVVSNRTCRPVLYRKVRAASVEIHSRHFDVHSAALSVDARFVGLRRLLHEWPVASGVFGLAFTALSVAALLAVLGRRVMTDVVRLAALLTSEMVLMERCDFSTEK